MPLWLKQFLVGLLGFLGMCAIGLLIPLAATLDGHWYWNALCFCGCPLVFLGAITPIYNFPTKQNPKPRLWDFSKIDF